MSSYRAFQWGECQSMVLQNEAARSLLGCLNTVIKWEYGTRSPSSISLSSRLFPFELEHLWRISSLWQSCLRTLFKSPKRSPQEAQWKALTSLCSPLRCNICKAQFEKCWEQSATGHANLSPFAEEEAVEEATSLKEEFGGERRQEVVVVDPDSLRCEASLWFSSSSFCCCWALWAKALL